MALEIAPAPPKAPPSGKSSSTAHSGRADAADRPSKSAEHGKSGQPSDPTGFLALLMGLGEEPAPEPPADSEALPVEIETSDTRDLASDLATVLPVAPAPTGIPETFAPSVVALTGTHGAQPLHDEKAGETFGLLTVDIAEKAMSGGRRRVATLADTSGPMGTQQLQEESPKEPSAKIAELNAAREGKPFAVPSQPETPSTPISASLQAPIAMDEARKSNHAGPAKFELADNLVVLSSGLSGAMAGVGGSAEAGLTGTAAQFQSVVAQEVAYYVSQDVQSAEMKLEGVGGGPVEVSINMQGKEAQVVFRTDELQTRDMLEGAAAQLKDMLQQQGVVLTGMFIGSSGAGDAGQQQERRFRQGARSETTLQIVTPEVRSVGISATGMGRTLDLYV